jgi:hypothetical protein
MSVLRNRGVYIVPGQYSQSGAVEIQPQLITFKALQIFGSSQYSISDVKKYIEFLGNNKDLFPIIEKLATKYPVSKVNEAIADAKKNAARNGITNAEFAVGAAEEVIPRLYEEEGITADIVVVDPPRKGCDERLLETILQISPEKIVYVSCNPATWARDLVVLKEGGYELKEVQPVDQFSHSVHVEVVSMLQKKQ